MIVDSTALLTITLTKNKSTIYIYVNEVTKIVSEIVSAQDNSNSLWPFTKLL